MRKYDDPVEVRRGADGGPDQFVWRGRLWRVRVVQAHWVETGRWWAAREAEEALGATEPAGAGTAVLAPDLLAEREVWRVEADRGAQEPGGVWELCFDWREGSWRLVGCMD